MPDRRSRRSDAASSSASATYGGTNSRIWPTSSSWFVPADRPTTLKRSGWRRTTSRACVPTDPVEPRITSVRTEKEYPRTAGFTGKPGGPRSEQDEPEVDEGRGRHEQQRVDPIQDAAVAGQDAAHVLDLEVPLEQRLGEIAEWGEDAHHDGQADRSRDRLEQLHRRRHGTHGDRGRDEGRSDRALPRLLRADV